MAVSLSFQTETPVEPGAACRAAIRWNTAFPNGKSYSSSCIKGMCNNLY